jgi:hypothetical protein
MKSCALLHRDIILKQNWNKTERLKNGRNKRHGGGERIEAKARAIECRERAATNCARSGNVLLLVLRCGNGV